MKPNLMFSITYNLFFLGYDISEQPTQAKDLCSGCCKKENEKSTSSINVSQTHGISKKQKPSIKKMKKKEKRKKQEKKKIKENEKENKSLEIKPQNKKKSIHGWK